VTEASPANAGAIVQGQITDCVIDWQDEPTDSQAPLASAVATWYA
jgi:hypothetical protein